MNTFTYDELKKKTQDYTVVDFVSHFGFDTSIHIARAMLNNDQWDDSLQNYATNLLETLRSKYPQKWDSTWRYDAILGYAYDIIFKYEDKFTAYMRAFDKIDPQPPELLVAIASCCWAPGFPPISEETAIEFLNKAIQTTPYIEAVELLIGINKSLGRHEEEHHWQIILKNLGSNGPRLPSLDQIP